MLQLIEIILKKITIFQLKGYNRQLISVVILSASWND